MNQWETNHYEMLKKDRFSQFKKEVENEDAKQPNEIELRSLVPELEEKCKAQVNPADILQYRDGLKLMRVGGLLKNNAMRQRGKDFCDKCTTKNNT